MIKREIEEIVKKASGVNGADVFAPERAEFGHYSSNVAMKLAKKGGKNPMEVARVITNNLQRTANNIFSKVEVAPPGFINFWVSQQIIQKEFSEIHKKGEKWGKPFKKPGKTAVIDYSGINIAKPMHAGHLRSTIIGQALYNIFSFSGWKTIGDNHLGDWGKQFGVLIAAYKENLKTKKLKSSKLDIDGLMNLYVDYSSRMKKDAALEEIAKEETKKLQSDDKENIKIWKNFYKITFSELDEVFKLLGIKFDYQLGESFYGFMLEDIVKDALKKGVAEKSDGAVVIFTDKNKSPLLIKKSDEAYLYGTTDLATVKYRVQKFKPETILYVVDNGQSLHFEQVFQAAKALGYAKKAELTHVKFGLILAEDMKKLSTRGGKHISLLELINEAVAKSEKIIKEKRPDLSLKEKNKIAEIIGVGALKYNDLSQNRQSDIAFKWETMLNLEGNSGPYLQYTYVRLKSIIAKSKIAKGKPARFDPKLLTEKEELNLILLLDKFPDVVGEITRSYYPHYLADYLYKLAKTANNYYHTTPVLKAEKNIREARLALIGAVARTLKTGLNLLGISVPEKM